MSYGRILFADNDLAFRKTRAEFLRERYEVLEAGSPEEVRRLLLEAWVHLLILDVRLIDDTDDRDVSGLAIAQEDVYHAIPKIILTGYPSYDQVRRAMRSAPDSPPAAVEYLAKTDGPDTMLQAVGDVFARHVRINRDLLVCWAAPSSFYHLVAQIEPAITSGLLIERANELEDLFRKLFYTYTQITIGRCFAQRAGYVALEVFAYNGGRLEEQCIVSCGRKETIDREIARYEAIALAGIEAVGTMRLRMETTPRLAAVVYQFAGFDIEQAATLRQVFDRWSAEEIAAMLDRLYEALALGHRRDPWPNEQRGWLDCYRGWLDLPADALTPAALGPRVGAICHLSRANGLAQFTCSTDRLMLHGSDGTSFSYPNPAVDLAETRMFDGPLPPYGLIHGNIVPDTIIADHNKQPRLIDIGHAGPGPLLADVVLLETAIKLDLVETSDMWQRYALEQQLLLDLFAARGAKKEMIVGLARQIDPHPSIAVASAGHGGEGFPPDLLKALIVVRRIRSQAAAGSDARLYLVGLLLCAIKRILDFDPGVRLTQRQLAPYAHALMTAAMCYAQLVDSQYAHLPQQARTSLWIDPDTMEVWVEGRIVPLARQDFKLLEYLYNRAGKLCLRKQLVREALDDAPAPVDDGDRLHMLDEASRLNTAMGRLRQKIEPDAERSKYIITARGRGYKLIL